MQMRKVISSVFVSLLLCGALAASAYADSRFFSLEPSSGAPEWDGSANPYSRNIFWDFSKNPANSGLGQGSEDAVYYGTNDSAALWADDYVARTGDVKRKDEAYGVFKKNQEGTAVFHIANLASSSAVKYFWLEMDINIKKAASYISAYLLPEGGSVTGSWGTGSALTWYGTTGGLSETVNAWFKIEPFSSAENLFLAFHSQGNGSHAFVDNVHIATTPEPIAAALFISGAAVMALKKRRQIRSAIA